MKANVKIKTGKRIMKNDKIELPVEVVYNFDTEVDIEGLTYKFEADVPQTIILTQKLGANANSRLSEKHMELERVIMDEKWKKQDSYDAKSLREKKKEEREQAEKATKEAIERDKQKRKEAMEAKKKEKEDNE